MPIRMYGVVVVVWTQGKRKLYKTDSLLNGVYKTCAWDQNGWTKICFEIFFKSTLALTKTLNKKVLFFICEKTRLWVLSEDTI